MHSIVIASACQVLVAAVRWLGWLNGVASLLLMLFSLAIGEEGLAAADLAWPMAGFLSGVLACALLAVSLALLRIGIAKRQPSEPFRAMFWLLVVFTILLYGLALLGFVGGCWLTLGVSDWADRDALYAVF